jgi:hypothetical protein
VSIYSDNRYKIFSWGKEYIIDPQCIDRVKALDGYRDFIWSYRAPIWLPIIIFSTILGALTCFFVHSDFELIKQMTIWYMGGIYALISIVYYIKIRKAIHCVK